MLVLPVDLPGITAAAIDGLAEAELRFGIQKDGRPQLLAVELARQASAHSAVKVLRKKPSF